jgi:maleylacetoacetate isomerase
VKLYSYWRSSAAYRVRIALHLKGVAFETIPVDLRHFAQQDGAYDAVNPQHLVPTLVDGAVVLGQSLAIIEYLEERFPAPPLLPAEPARRARARHIALAIAADLHPLNNLRVLRYLKTEFRADEAARQAWYHHWLKLELGAVERLVEAGGPYALGGTLSLADLCIVPQLYNARRYAFSIEPYPRLCRIDAACAGLEAFWLARPEVQADAPAEESR